MAFQLIIRNNLKHDADSFTGSQAALFDNGLVKIGSSEECQCQVLDQEGRGGDEIWFEVEEREDGFFLCRHTDLDIYLNRDRMEAASHGLVSGDNIRVGHWTFRFQKIHSHAPVSKHTDRIPRLCKAALLIFIVIQLLVALWLPGQLPYEKMAPQKVVEQKTVMLLDHLRRQVSSFPSSSDQMTGSNAVLRILSSEIDQIASYMRRHQDQIPHRRWHDLRDDLEMYQELLDLVGNSQIPPEQPELAVAAAVREIERETEWKTRMLKRITDESPFPSPLD